MTLRDSSGSVVGVSRRRLLAALGAVGVTSATTGFATAAYFSDREAVAGTVAGGAVELKADYRATVEGEPSLILPADAPATVDCRTPDLLDGGLLPTLELTDVQPTDSGAVASCLYVCGNPSYLWFRACVDEDDEVAYTDHEADAGDGTATDGELADAVDVVLYLDRDGDGVRGPDDPVVYRGSMAGLSAFACAGIPVGVPPAETAPVFNPAPYEAVLAPDLADGCTGLGKLEEPDGEDGDGTFTAFEPGDDMGFGASIFTGVSYDAAENRYVFTTASGEAVLVEPSGEQFNADGELVEVTLTVRTPGVGFCRTRVKSGAGADSLVEEDHAGCPQSVTLRTPNPSLTEPLASSRMISHVTLFVCERPVPPEPVCYDGAVCLGLEWSVPRDAGPEISTDTVSLEFAVAATQCRHDEAPVSPFGDIREEGGDA